MKALLACLLAAGVVHGAAALTATPSPVLGTWSADTSRLPMPVAARPKRVTIAFADAGDGKWTTQVDITDAAGVQIHSISTAALDGSAAPIKGGVEADTAALRQPSPNVLVMALSKGGVPGSTRIYTVGADGRSLVETAVYFGDHGEPIMRTHYFTRLR